jgi:hypothetical protein
MFECQLVVLCDNDSSRYILVIVVSTAQTYAKTIISEYFLHVKDKGIVCKNMGGIAGGQVSN